MIKNKNIQKAILFGDSLNTLTSVQNTLKPNEMGKMIQNKIFTIQSESFFKEIIWNSGHTDITSNERADKLAKDVITAKNAVQLKVYGLSDIK